MVFVRVSETYDLSTKVNKLGIVGVHTPKTDLIARNWKGLMMNFGKFRFASCDVTLACASILPADPLQVGVEAGSIAPQDMFNPILYKAVSNDSMNTFLQFLYGCELGVDNGVVALSKGSIIDVHDTKFTTAAGDVEVDQFKMYYGLLSNSGGWKKAMPQAGLQMRGLYPLVFQRLSNVGYTGQDDDSGYVPFTNDASTHGPATNYAKSLRGHACRMPFVPTTYFVGKNTDANVDGSQISHTMDGWNIPSAYVGLIILPPAKLNQLYYRLKVTWTVEFSEIRSTLDIANWSILASAGDVAYGTDYTAQASKMSSTLDMVDTQGAEIEKIMEGTS